LSPCHHSFKAKRRTRTAKRANKTIMAAEFHGLVIPPHSIARRKQIVDVTIRKVPTKSICRAFSNRVASAGDKFGGALKRIRMTIAEVIPSGKLM